MGFSQQRCAHICFFPQMHAPGRQVSPPSCSLGQEQLRHERLYGKSQRGGSIMQNGLSCWESEKSPIFQVRTGRKACRITCCFQQGKHSLLRSQFPWRPCARSLPMLQGKAWHVTPASGPLSLIYGFVDSPQSGAQRLTPGFAVKNPCNLGEVTSRALSSILEFCR